MAAPTSPDARRSNLGARIAPPRFLAFLAIFLIGTPLAIGRSDWRIGPMIAFDVAAILFLLLLIPLFDDTPDEVRGAARRNDANRLLLLAITGIVSIVVLVAVAAELSQSGSPKPATIALIIGTLAVSWLFTNTIYALHYAHLYYGEGDGGDDCGGLDIPETAEPDYWDFFYFASCLGMTFQTSDVEITDRRIRHVVTGHCLIAFVFNLGIVAFTINVLGGG